MASPVAFISMTENFGGHEVMLTRWLKELMSQQDIAPVFVSAQNAKVRASIDGIGLDGTYIKPRPAIAKRLPRAMLKPLTLAHLITNFALLRFRTGARDAVVSEGALMSEAMSTIAARLVFRRVHVYVPMVESFAALGYPDADGATKRFMRIYKWLPSSWITLSDDHARIFRTWSKVSQPIHVLRNTTADEIEKRGHQRTPKASDSQALSVLILGRLTAHHKGLDLLLDHVKQNFLALQEAGIKFRLVGDGEYKTELLAALDSNPALNSVLELAPWSPPLEAYQQADCVLLASRIEGVPLVMLEAMALRIPVIASDLPGTRGYLDGDCLFPVGDLGGALEQIKRLRDPTFRESCTEKNARRYEELASSRAFALNTQQLSKELLS